jgi:hypothetical protein
MLADSTSANIKFRWQLRVRSIVMHRLEAAIAELLVLLLVLTVAGNHLLAQDDPPDDPDKSKWTIKKVMKQAHKDGLTEKVALGNASDEEKKQLHEMYEALTKLKPPKGSDESWEDKTTKLVDAAQAAIDGEQDAGKKLTAASNCKSCHNEHK